MHKLKALWLWLSWNRSSWSVARFSFPVPNGAGESNPGARWILFRGDLTEWIWLPPTMVGISLVVPPELHVCQIWQEGLQKKNVHQVYSRVRNSCSLPKNWHFFITCKYAWYRSIVIIIDACSQKIHQIINFLGFRVISQIPKLSWTTSKLGPVTGSLVTIILSWIIQHFLKLDKRNVAGR